MHFALLSERCQNFQRKLFNSTKDSFSKPHIIYAYLPSKSDFLNTFQEFENNYSDNSNFMTTAINCYKYPTSCEKAHVIPDSISISIEPHQNISIRSSLSLSYKSLQQIAAKIEAKNIYEVHDLNVLKEYALDAPTFLFISSESSNSHKFRFNLYSKIAMNFIQKNIHFLFAIDNSLMSYYTKDQVSILSFIGPSGESIQYYDDYETLSLNKFIKKYNHEPFSSTIPLSDLIIILISNNITDYDKRKLLHSTNQLYPISFINSSDNEQAYKYICNRKIPCYIAYNSHRYTYSILEPDNILEGIDDFKSKRNSLSKVESIKRVFFAIMSFDKSTFNSMISTMTASVIILICYVFGKLYSIPNGTIVNE